MSLNGNTWLAITLTFVLAGLFFVFLSGGAEAADYKHEVSIDPTSQSGEPEDTLTYTITIENKGEKDDTYFLGMISTTPTGWSMYILPTSISISDDSSGTVTLYVGIGNRTTALGDVTKQFSAYCNSTSNTIYSRGLRF